MVNGERRLPWFHRAEAPHTEISFVFYLFFFFCLFVDFHLIFALNNLKESYHHLLEALEKLFLLAFILAVLIHFPIHWVGNEAVWLVQDFVDEHHDVVIVVAILPIFKRDLGEWEHVVSIGLEIVDLRDEFIQFSIDLFGLTEGILQQWVRQYFLSQSLVDEIKIFFSHLVVFRQFDDCSQNIFRTKYFCLWFAQLVLNKIFERSRKHCIADCRQPLIYLGVVNRCLILG